MNLWSTLETTSKWQSIWNTWLVISVYYGPITNQQNIFYTSDMLITFINFSLLCLKFASV